MIEIFRTRCDTDLICWNTAKIREKLENDIEFSNLVERDDAYRVTPTLLVLYDFSKAPLEGVYKSVAFDNERGIVATRKSTKSLINEYMKHTIFNLTHTKWIHYKLNLHHSQVLSQGRYSYFSLKGHSKSSADWVALHQMQHLKKHHDQSSFVSKDGIVFHFEHEFIDVKNNLGESIAANRMMCELFEESASQLGYVVKPESNCIGSLATNWDYGRADLIELAQEVDVVQSLEEIHDERTRKTLQIIRDDLGADLGYSIKDDVKFIEKRLKRVEYNLD